MEKDERRECQLDSASLLDLPPFGLPLTFCPCRVPSKNVIDELYARSSLSLRLSNNLGVTALLLLNCTTERSGRRG